MQEKWHWNVNFMHVTIGWWHGGTLYLLPRFPATLLSTVFYTTSDFAAVKLKGDYTGGTDYKDVFSGQATLDLTPYRCRLAVRHREEIQLERPLAKIELITTDVIKYLNKLEQMKSVRPAGIEDFTVQLVYTGYFPTGF